MGLEFGPADTFPKNTWSYYFNTVTYRGKFTVSIYMYRTHTHSGTSRNWVSIWCFNRSRYRYIIQLQTDQKLANNAVAKKIIFHAHWLFCNIYPFDIERL